MTLGHNTASGRELQDIVERIEKVRAEKKELANLESAILADAKSRGYAPKVIRVQVKRRAMKPNERAEADALLDTYEHAVGDAIEAPLHRMVGQFSVDVLVRDQVLEALKAFCPPDGSIVLEHGGKPVKLSRAGNGEVIVDEDWTPHAPGPLEEWERSLPKHAAPPDVDDDGAYALGAEAFRTNKPIVENPFPFGDGRRPRWDKGWRDASGGDGMGPR